MLVLRFSFREHFGEELLLVIGHMIRHVTLTGE